VTITAWDVDLDGYLTTGTHTLSVHGSKVEQTIGLGSAGKDLQLNGDELQRITATGGLTIGSTSGGTLTLRGVTQTHSDYLLPVVTLIASHDNANVHFESASSTFYALEVLADNGIIIEKHVNTDAPDTPGSGGPGSMYLDGDMENDASGDSLNTVGFTDGKLITSRIHLTLEATSGTIVPAAKLSLRAGAGITVLDDMTTTGSNKPLVIDADYESEGDGTLTVWTGKTITSNKSDVTITAWDFDLDGSLTSGTRTISIHGSKVEQTIGLGAASKDSTVDTAELQRVTALGGIMLGSYSSGTMTVEGVTQANSDYLLPLVTLVAQHEDAQVIFENTASTFFALGVQADDGVVVKKCQH